MSNKIRFTLVVAVVLTLILVISSAACISQANVGGDVVGQIPNAENPASQLSVEAVQVINYSTGKQVEVADVSLKESGDRKSKDATVLSFDANPRDILRNDSIASLTFSITDTWVLEAQQFIEKIRTYLNETESEGSITLHIVLYEYDKAGNRIFVGDSPVTISADTVSIKNGKDVFLISPDVLASGKYELRIALYSGLDMETMRSGLFDDLKVKPNAQFNAGSDGLLKTGGIYATEKSWSSVKQYVIPSISWGYTQTIITANPTTVPIYDPNANYTLMTLDMPWRLHWKINDAQSASSSNSATASPTPTASPTKTATPTVTPAKTATPTATVLGVLKSKADDEEPEDPLDDMDDAIPTKSATPTPAPTKSATPTPAPTKSATPTPTPGASLSPSAHQASTTANGDYYKNVEFILYSYDDGYYQIVDRFGWNLGYSSDKEQFTKAYQPGTYALIAFVRGVGVTLDFQQQKVMV